MADDLFESPRILLDQARDHIHDLNERGRAFFEKKPYAMVAEFDRETGEDVHAIRITAKTPGKIAAVTADALNNLKSVLDHAVCASVQALRPAASLAGIQFRFGDSEDRFGESVRRGCKNVAPEIVAIAEAARPYRGGNDFLWSLSRISAANRHRMLRPIAVAADNAIGIRAMRLEGSAKLMAPVWNRSKNELEFARTARGSRLQYDVDFSFFIAFGDVDVVAGQPVVPVLRDLACEVENIFMEIEKTTHLLTSP